MHHLERDDGTQLAWRVTGDTGAPAVVLLHATLSTSGQLRGLARLLAEGGRRVFALDRRGSGGSRLAEPRPVDVPTHVSDVAALLDAEDLQDADLVGHSFGGVVALESAARLPARVRSVVAYEPPYIAIADAATLRGMRRVASATEAAYAAEGGAGAAREFLDGIAGGLPAWDGLPERTRTFLAGEGAGVLADVAMRGLDPGALGAIRAPVALLAGTASEPFYRPIIDALAARIPGARVTVLPGLRHASPIIDPVPVAAAILAALAGRLALEVPAT